MPTAAMYAQANNNNAMNRVAMWLPPPFEQVNSEVLDPFGGVAHDHETIGQFDGRADVEQGDKVRYVSHLVFPFEGSRQDCQHRGHLFD
jgi:hypothetical protein